MMKVKVIIVFVNRKNGTIFEKTSFVLDFLNNLM